MNKTDILTLYDYHYWATGRVLGAAGRATTEQFVTPTIPGHASLRGTLVHMLSAERTWRLRCQEGESPASPLAEADFATVEALAERWREEEARMRTYLVELTGEALIGAVHYRTTQGVPYEHPVWQALVQAVNHGTQHRSEAALMLTVFGASPGNLDLIVYFRELQETK